MKIKRKLLIVLIVLLSIGCDQLSKSVARNNIKNNETIHILKDYIVLIKAENTGAAFGVGSNLPLGLKIFYFQLIPVAILLFLFRMILVDKDLSKLLVVGVALTVGGAFGNIIDRILDRSVTDFIQIHTETYTSGIFNVADILLVLGIVLVIIDLSFNNKKI